MSKNMIPNSFDDELIGHMYLEKEQYFDGYALCMWKTNQKAYNEFADRCQTVYYITVFLNNIHYTVARSFKNTAKELFKFFQESVLDKDQKVMYNGDWKVELNGWTLGRKLPKHVTPYVQNGDRYTANYEKRNMYKKREVGHGDQA